MLVVKFNDYQVPAVQASLYGEYKSYLCQVPNRRSPGAVRLVLKDFPAGSRNATLVSRPTLHPFIVRSRLLPSGSRAEHKLAPRSWRNTCSRISRR